MKKSCFLILGVVFIVTLQSCLDEKVQAVQQGKELAKKHCVGCHQFPPADLLPKDTWTEYVLPKMSRYFGLTHLGMNRYYESEAKTAVIDLQQWSKIVYYYVSQSPIDSLKQSSLDGIATDLTNFNIDTSLFTSKVPATTFIKHFPESNEILFADGITGKLYRVEGMNVLDSINVSTGLAHLELSNNGYLAMTMGIMYPSDEKLGKLSEINPESQEVKVLIDSLQRPVHFQNADLNNDGKQDYVICQFGNLNGRLSWFESLGADKYKEHILRALPGSVKTEIVDLNLDGRLDIMVLMAQGDEGIFVYYNEGNARFKEKRLLELSPSYGSNYFELVDFNKDGFLDIIATNGDNGDYPPVLKPYHGIRLYINDKQGNFREELFIPLNGVAKSQVVDIDLDGDLDVVAISYFPDYENSVSESFVLFTNDGNNKFSRSTFPGSSSGRWLTMDVSDIDSDGDEDILLGCAPFSLGEIPFHLKEKWNAGSAAVIILRNNLKTSARQLPN